MRAPCDRRMLVRSDRRTVQANIFAPDPDDEQTEEVFTCLVTSSSHMMA